MEKNLKILVVDDEYSARKLLSRLLSPFGHCDTAEGGNDAVAAVREALSKDEPYDLICLDIMMSDMDGQQALKAIRQIEAHRGIWPGRGSRIIMTTAMEDAENIMKAFIEQCESYLVKPIERRQLIKEMVALNLIDPEDSRIPS